MWGFLVGLFTSFLGKGLKIVMFVFFIGSLYFVLGQVFSYLVPYVQSINQLSSNILFLPVKLGIFEGLNIYIDILLVGWVYKNILSFIKGI